MCRTNGRSAGLARPLSDGPAPRPFTATNTYKQKKPRPCGGAFARASAGLKTCRCQRQGDLLGSGSASSGRSSGVSSSLGSVGRRSGSCVRSSRCGRSSFRSGRSWCRSRCRCFHRSGRRCWSGFFLLATSGECSSCDQGGQNERVLHFDFPSWTDRVLREATASGFVIAPDPLAHALGLHHFGAASNYIGI